MNISTQKTKRANEKRLQKTNKTIQKIFSQLRNESVGESSIIELDDSQNSALNDTINNDEVCITGIIPAKNNVQCKRTSNAPIIIKDNQPGISTPNKNKFLLHHSTPIKKPSLEELIIATNNQILNATSNKTKEINSSSYLTIDLTADSSLNPSNHPTVIDLDKTNEQDSLLTSISNTSSMSGDSQVTILRRPNTNNSLRRQMRNGIANLNKRDKDKILAFLTENIFNGCSVSTQDTIEPRALETADDVYIKDVIVGSKLSRNSIGSNIYNPHKYVNTTGLRMIVIDGSNVALAHSNHKYFSVPGLKIVIDYFLNRGHVVKAFVPRFRNKSGKCSHPQMLHELERQGHVVFTPSREVAGKNITCYDDRYIIQCAAEFDGIIVTNDQFRDLFEENPRWRTVIQSQVLPYNWVNNMIMFPRDPLGRNGPTLENFLKTTQGNCKNK